MSQRNEKGIVKAKYTIRSRRRLNMEFSNGRIDVFIKNQNLNIRNAADMPLCLAALLETFPFENKAPMTWNVPGWSESDLRQSALEAQDKDCTILMTAVRNILLRYVIHCRKCRRDISKVVIRKKPT